ncbi:MAG: hypothetical protein EOM19_05540 [Candidatus Moranbacteria bacterium]|nr:hypothetical protein [Candidatus Moranbacteria bacterium]
MLYKDGSKKHSFQDEGQQMFTTVTFSTFWFLVFFFGAWLLLSLVTELFTWLNDGDEEFFEGIWIGEKFGKLSFFGYPIKNLTSSKIEKKRFIVPYMLQDSEEFYYPRAFCVALVLLPILSIIIPLGIYILLEYPLFFSSLFFMIFLSLFLKKKIRKAKKRSSGK